jgi:hypothetical protein
MEMEIKMTGINVRAQTPLERTDEASSFSNIYQFYYQPLLMIGFLLCSWWTSYTGVLAMAEFMSGVSEHLSRIALLVTASAMGAQFVLWHYAMRLIPRYVTHAARGIGILVLLVLIVMLALSSTYTSFIGLTQDSARGLELQRQSDLYAEKARILAPRASAMEDALFAIAPEANAACTRYEQELTSGVITGARGKGAVTGQFLKLCETKTAIANALEETIAANAARMGEIQSLSAQLDRIIYDRSQSIGQRELDFIDLARRMDALLLQLENADRTNGIRASSQAMANSIAELADTGNTLAAAQAQAVASIIREERESGQAIAELIEGMEALPRPEPGRAVIKPSQTLVLEHWKLHLPQLAISACIDLFAPLSTLLFWAAAIRARRPNQNPQKGRKQ